ncbi:uncharacterized protein LOC130911202 [Corythoichthys intestinalis]|uniref:uncharacterized protein LOC130911202 n=1 Tax=Corythoichthys intestinalis TaxID=161448 RepID=UPI0025A58A43|nr:uncharacterized protein LOC130911202 [Corythoichthys intestinalis]
MWWLVLVVLSYLDREAVRAAVRSPVEERGSEQDVLPFMAKEEAKKRGSEEMLRRAKRGFTYPGTLWCGPGNMADHYDQLGKFKKTDSCCRTHDNCPHVIHAFSTKYGYTNFKFHSICHCDCDEALKNCLRQVNDTSSRVVGQTFFNVIGSPCFDLIYEEHCAERHWYGVCKRYEKLPIAVVKEAVPYDYGGIDVIDVVTRAPPKEKGDSETEGMTDATLPYPEEPFLGNMVTAAEDFIKVLATVSSTSTADTDKESQSSEKKKKKEKDRAKKKKKKGKGRKRKEKVIDQTATQRLSEGKSEPSNEVMKDEPLMETAKYPQTTAEISPLAASPSKNRQPKKGSKKENIPLTNLQEVPQLPVHPTSNLPAIPKSQPEQKFPSKEIPQPAVYSLDILSLSSTMTAGETTPPARSLSKTRQPGKARRKEDVPMTSLEEIPQLTVESYNLSVPSRPTILIPKQLPGEEILQPEVELIQNLSVTYPVIAEETTPHFGYVSKIKKPKKGRKMERVLVTSSEEIPQPKFNLIENLSVTLTPINLNKQILQPMVDFTNSQRFTSPLTPNQESSQDGSPAKIRHLRKGRRKEKAPVTQPALDTTENLHPIVMSQPKRQGPGEVNAHRRRESTNIQSMPSIPTTQMSHEQQLGDGIPQTPVTSINTIILEPQSEQQLPGVDETPSPAVDLTEIHVIHSIPMTQQWSEQIPKSLRYITPTSTPAMGIPQLVVKSTSNQGATFISASQPAQHLGEKIVQSTTSAYTILVSQSRQQSPGEGRSVPVLTGIPNVKRKHSQDKGANEGRKKKTKPRPNLGTQSIALNPTIELSQIPVTITAGFPTVTVVQRRRFSEGRQRTGKITTAVNGLSVARRKKPKKSGKKSMLASKHSNTEFPGLTSTLVPAKERVEQLRPRVSVLPKANAIERSLERLREQFAWKKRRKAARSTRTLAV